MRLLYFYLYSVIGSWLAGRVGRSIRAGLVGQSREVLAGKPGRFVYELVGCSHYYKRGGDPVHQPVTTRVSGSGHHEQEKGLTVTLSPTGQSNCTHWLLRSTNATHLILHGPVAMISFIHFAVCLTTGPQQHTHTFQNVLHIFGLKCPSSITLQTYAQMQHFTCWQ